MNLAVITSKFPFDGKEAFLHAEIGELAKRVQSLAIIPATAKSKEHLYTDLPGTVRNVSALSPDTLLAATAELLKAPMRVWFALGEVITKPRSWRTRLNNLMIFPKALAIARFVRQRNISHVHAYWLSTPSTIAYVTSRLTDAQWSATGHRWDLVDTNLTSQPVARAGFMPHARFIRTISDRGCRQVKFALGNYPAARVRKIHLGVKTPGCALPAPSEARPFNLVCIAGMERVKGHTYLLSALASARVQGLDVRCDLIGDGSLRRHLEELAVSLGIGCAVNFLGRIPLEAVHDLLRRRSYDAAILTSIDEGSNMCEGIPVSLMEAMAFQIPCIATDSGSVRELVDNDVGVLVTPCDFQGIARAILSLAHDPERRLRLGVNAGRRIVKDFGVNRSATELFALIEPSADRIRQVEE